LTSLRRRVERLDQLIEVYFGEDCLSVNHLLEKVLLWLTVLVGVEMVKIEREDRRAEAGLDGRKEKE